MASKVPVGGRLLRILAPPTRGGARAYLRGTCLVILPPAEALVARLFFLDFLLIAL